jgi:hypothetical protein
MVDAISEIESVRRNLSELKSCAPEALAELDRHKIADELSREYCRIGGEKTTDLRPTSISGLHRPDAPTQKIRLVTDSCNLLQLLQRHAS